MLLVKQNPGIGRLEIPSPQRRADHAASSAVPHHRRGFGVADKQQLSDGVTGKKRLVADSRHADYANLLTLLRNNIRGTKRGEKMPEAMPPPWLPSVPDTGYGRRSRGAGGAA
jgi:hypothetical protein